MFSSSSLKRNILLVTPQRDPRSVGGRELLSQLNRGALEKIYGNKLLVWELSKRPLRGIEALCGVFTGHIDGLDGAVIQQIVSAIRKDEIKCVFLDGSNLGAAAKAISRACCEVQVITFFHNCEARFFWGAFRQARTLRALGVLLANYLAERRAVRFSDKRVCLSKRDSDLLGRLYGRSATHISAMAMQDKSPTVRSPDTRPAEKYVLFVGGAFYANKAGIEWFCRKVAPHITMTTYVVGRGLQTMKDSLESQGSVTVVGEVQDLAPWYRSAQFVVAPIFDGSGMKTKVAEALMFGKRIIGTPEAFSGYEEHVASAGVVCRSAGEFIAAINGEIERGGSTPSADLRRIYQDHYSQEAAQHRLAAILNDEVSLTQTRHL